MGCWWAAIVLPIVQCKSLIFKSLRALPENIAFVHIMNWLRNVSLFERDRKKKKWKGREKNWWNHRERQNQLYWILDCRLVRIFARSIKRSLYPSQFWDLTQLLIILDSINSRINIMYQLSGYIPPYVYTHTHINIHVYVYTCLNPMKLLIFYCFGPKTFSFQWLDLISISIYLSL